MSSRTTTSTSALHTRALLTRSTYVVPRKPCLIRGHISGAQFHKWDLDHLEKVAGHHVVDVEHRESAKHRFGECV